MHIVQNKHLFIFCKVYFLLGEGSQLEKNCLNTILWKKNCSNAKNYFTISHWIMGSFIRNKVCLDFKKFWVCYFSIIALTVTDIIFLLNEYIYLFLRIWQIFCCWVLLVLFSMFLHSQINQLLLMDEDSG